MSDVVLGHDGGFKQNVERVEGAGLIRGFQADGSRGVGECVSHLLSSGGTGSESTPLGFEIQLRCALCGALGGSVTGVLLRIGTKLMISCLLTLVALFLTGLGLGDSPLVILSLCSVVLFFVISPFDFLVFLFSSFLFFFLFVPLSVSFVMSLFSCAFLI